MRQDHIYCPSVDAAYLTAHISARAATTYKMRRSTTTSGLAGLVILLLSAATRRASCAAVGELSSAPNLPDMTLWPAPASADASTSSSSSTDVDVNDDLSITGSVASAPDSTGPDARCVHTVRQLRVLNLGATRTVYAHTTTAMVAVDCGDCVRVTAVPWGGHGPVAHWTATVTESVRPAVKTSYYCSGDEEE